MLARMWKITVNEHEVSFRGDKNALTLVVMVA